MENEEKQMTGEESFGIIMEMINKTKVNISQGSFHLLFWGWLIFACSLSEFILRKFTDFAHPYYVWFFVVPGVIVSVIYGFVKGRRERVMTYAASVYLWTWVAFLLSAIVLFFLVQDGLGSYGPLILTLAAMPTFISGVILKFRPLLIGGFTFWIFALIAHFGGEVLSSLATPAAMLTGYLIPGYLLRRKNNHDTV
jgi:hypothetical protein